LIELVDLELQELLTKYEFPGDDIPIIHGSALKALECGCGKRECANCGPILELLDALDESVPEPARDTEKPFLMPIEDVFSISGRGTVVTGRVERGIVKVGDEVEIVGIKETEKTVCTGVEMFGIHNPPYEIQGRGLYPHQRGGWKAYAVFHRLPAPVLLPDNGRDRCGDPS